MRRRGPEAFDSDRLLFGSDWPVCTLRADYSEVVRIAGHLVEGLSPGERNAVFHGNALRVYRLQPPGDIPKVVRVRGVRTNREHEAPASATAIAAARSRGPASSTARPSTPSPSAAPSSPQAWATVHVAGVEQRLRGTLGGSRVGTRMTPARRGARAERSGGNSYGVC
ncbi:amidohydrolase [Streptomyces sp. NBC_01244]|nr:amidohydrolase [Streptomyces sp. NBC_01244]